MPKGAVVGVECIAQIRDTRCMGKCWELFTARWFLLCGLRGLLCIPCSPWWSRLFAWWSGARDVRFQQNHSPSDHPLSIPNPGHPGDKGRADTCRHTRHPCLGSFSPPAQDSSLEDERPLPRSPTSHQQVTSISLCDQGGKGEYDLATH